MLQRGWQRVFGDKYLCIVCSQRYLLLFDLRFFQPVHVGDHRLKDFPVELVGKVHRLIDVEVQLVAEGVLCCK